MEAPSVNGEKKDTRIKPGEVRNPAGRPKGARSKLGEAFLQEMHEDFRAHGKEVIARVREEKPDQYLKVVASILPKEISADEPTMNMLGELLERIDGRTRTITSPYQRAETVQ